jgi:hypothetical protein
MNKEPEKSAPKIEATFSIFEFESTALLETDAMGREKFWEDIGRKND